ncbi:MAG: phosphomannomutase/phosphoglucomutase [Candidatus Nealsonbacteria bacterium]|nr:phosphomannomutase/phosphoglucomutase [Candidatus Nealsonbacteria bacterium]
MKVNPYIFRGYDIRGLVDKDLNPEIVEHLGRSYGAFLLRRGIKKAVIGRDCRLTSESYSEAIIKGILSAGVNVIDIGLALAGTISWAQHYFEAEGYVSVSASHNPAEYNGFKLGTGLSSTMVSEEIQELRQIAESGKFSQGQGILERKDIKEAYFNNLFERFSLPFNFKVVVDPSNSTPGIFVPELLKKAGCEVICKNCEIDGSFPIGTPDPTSKEVAERLKEAVSSSGANLGFSYDSDGDRIGVVDDKGNIIWNDALLPVFVKDVLNDHPGATIMYNALCSKAVEETIVQYGGKPFMWRTGYSFLKKKNEEIKAAFIGELSGHFFFSADFYNHDDGLYSTLRLLSHLAKSKQPLSAVIKSFPEYISSPEIKLFCPDEKKVGLMAEIGNVLKNSFPEAQIIDDERVGDGVRLNLSDGMFIIRYSQNGPYLTIQFEAKTQDRYNFLKDYIKKLLHNYKEVDWNSKINVNADSLD